MPNVSIEEINSKMKSDYKSYVSFCEKQYDEKLESVCTEIAENSGHYIVMIAGPSSSGKTTTADILKNKLNKMGRGAKVISLDDFYKDQDESYTFEDGTVDYETVKALDVDYITVCLKQLVYEGSCMLPHFDFLTSKRDSYTKTVLTDDEIVIVEGLHALNDIITEPLSNLNMKKIYISVSSRITMNGEILMTKRDIRLTRRLIRDYHFRGSSVENTFYLWNGVRMGEDRYLFPFSDRANLRIDTIHPYEICIFKDIATKLLDGVDENSVYYPTALELKNKLQHFYSLPEQIVPENSLLREFIGKSDS